MAAFQERNLKGPQVMARTKPASYHAAAQRRYAAKMREKGIPRADDLGRALLQGVAVCAPDDRNSEAGRLWLRVMQATLEELENRGFDRTQAHACLIRILTRNRRYQPLKL